MCIQRLQDVERCIENEKRDREELRRVKGEKERAL